MNEDGTLARLEEKYLGHGNDFDYVDTRTFLRAVQNTLPDLKPLFEIRPTDRLATAGGDCPAGVALGSAGHLADRRARYDDANP